MRTQMEIDCRNPAVGAKPPNAKYKKSNEGVHAKAISERLGHADISTTMNTYGHVLEEADKKAASHFDSFFTKEEKKA